jgi:peptidoglycan glycosyltransferase
MMIDTVESGSVRSAQIDGYTVGGKTGTAETGSGSNHSWFIGFIGNPGEQPKYAVAVVLEEGTTGLAGPVGIGRDILAQSMQEP